MKKLFLHIGMHKTGTSSIQASLTGYDDGITAYCDLGKANHGIPLTTIFSANRYNYYVWKNKGFSASRIDELSAFYKDRLDRFLEEHEHENLIVSGEEIRFLENEEKRTLVRYFESKGYIVSIYCLVRNPAKFTVSALQQVVKGGRDDVARIDPKYRFSLEQFSALIPAQRIFVQDFDAVLAAHGDVVSWFASSLGLDLEKVVNIRVNESLSATATKLIFRLNRLPLSTIGTIHHVQARKKLMNRISEQFPRDRFPALDREICQHAISPAVSDDLLYLKNKYSIDYQLPDESTQRIDINDYLLDLEDCAYAGLLELAESERIPVCPGSSVEELLTLLFVNYLLGPSLQYGDADYLRDIAIKTSRNGKFSTSESLALMELAQRARPDGPFIAKKVKEYRSELNMHSDE